MCSSCAILILLSFALLSLQNPVKLGQAIVNITEYNSDGAGPQNNTSRFLPLSVKSSNSSTGTNELEVPRQPHIVLIEDREFVFSGYGEDSNIGIGVLGFIKTMDSGLADLHGKIARLGPNYLVPGNRYEFEKVGFGRTIRYDLLGWQRGTMTLEDVIQVTQQVYYFGAEWLYSRQMPSFRVEYRNLSEKRWNTCRGTVLFFPESYAANSSSSERYVPTKGAIDPQQMTYA